MTGPTCREYARGIGRPRLFWNDDKGNRFFATAGVTIEDRQGGSPSYVEALDTRGFDAGLLDQRIISGQYVVTTRAAWSQKHHDHQFGDIAEEDRHTTAFGEVTVRGTAGSHTWVAGAAVESDRYQRDRRAAIQLRLHDARRVRAGRCGASRRGCR